MSDSTNKDRRQNADRRNPTSRRRHADSRSLYLELCHSVLRVAIVMEGDANNLPTLQTRTVRWRFDAPDLMSEQGNIELTAALRSLVTEERLAGCRVSLAISSTLCVNRATSGAIAKVEQQIADLEDRSQLYLSLGPGPKTSAIGRKQIDARHEHALVTVANEHTLQLLVAAAESAGLSVDVVESALVALSRLQGQIDREDESAVILAQLDEQRFEIGISRGGQLLLEYRPAASARISQLGEVIDDHYDRFERYCGRQYGVGNMEIDRVWIVGEPDEVKATNAQTETKLTSGVLPMESLSKHWQLGDSDPITAEMGAALGLALRGRYDETGVSPNLMDEIHAQAKTPLRPILLRALAPIAATLLVAATLWAVNLERQSQLAVLRSQFDEIRPVELRGKQMAKQIADAAIEIEHTTKLVASTPQREINPLIKRLGACLPEDVWLKGFRLLEENKAALSGASYTEGGVYDFVRYLEASPDYVEVALRGTGVDQTPQGPATSFEIDVELTPALPATIEEDS